jgi:hypothetical protein
MSRSRTAIDRAVKTLANALWQGAAAIGFAVSAAHAQVVPEFSKERASADVHYVAEWAMRSADNAELPFVIVDKVESRVYVFNAQGRLLGAASALVGLASGDDSVPGIGSRKMSTITPAERTTPAGRFVASMERSLHGDEILWVDYDAAIALHRVITTVPAERRLQRLASSAAADHRITYGCINVPVKFFDHVVLPAFKGRKGIVYVLPERRSASEMFGVREEAPSPTR